MREECKPQLILEVMDLAAEGRLRKMQPRRRARDVLSLGDGDKISQMAQLHATGRACRAGTNRAMREVVRDVSGYLSVKVRVRSLLRNKSGKNASNKIIRQKFPVATLQQCNRVNSGSE